MWTEIFSGFIVIGGMIMAAGYAWGKIHKKNEGPEPEPEVKDFQRVKIELEDINKVTAEVQECESILTDIDLCDANHVSYFTLTYTPTAGAEISHTFEIADKDGQIADGIRRATDADRRAKRRLLADLIDHFHGSTLEN